MSLTHLPSQQQARQTTSEQSQSSCNKVLPRALRFEMVWANFLPFWLVWARLDQFGFFDMQERQWRVGRVGNCHPDFGRIEGATRQWRSAKLLLPTQFRQLLRPLNYNVLQLYHKALRVTLLQGLLAEHTSG